MVLSRRETIFAATTLLAVALLGLDRLIMSPLQARRAALDQQRQQALTELENARRLFEQKKLLGPRWKQMQEAGLKLDQSDAESQILHTVRNWAQQSGLVVTLVRPEHSGPRGELQEITFQTAATGPMNAVAGFLWLLESSTLPVRVTDLSLGSRKEGTDDLSLQIGISALCKAGPAAAAPAAPAAPKQPEDKEL